MSGAPNDRRSRRLAAVALATVLIGVAVVAWRVRLWPRPAPPPPPAATAAQTDASADVLLRVPVGAPSANRTAVVFPPHGTPVAEMVAVLKPAAAAGDARAACRLAAELYFCRIAEMHVQGKLTETVAAARGDVEIPSEDGDLDVAMVDTERACRELPPELHARADAWLASAARAGNIEAMVQYIQGSFLFRRSAHDFIAHPEFDRWRRDAPVMLEQLLRAGVPEAAFLMMIGTSADLGLAAAVIPDDPVRNLAAMILMRRLRGTATRPNGDRFDAATVRRAQALAATWHHEYFDDRIVAESELTQRVNWMPPAFGGMSGEWREPCTD